MDWYEDWLSLTESHTSPLLRSLTLKLDIADKDDVYNYLKIFRMTDLPSKIVGHANVTTKTISVLSSLT